MSDEPISHTDVELLAGEIELDGFLNDLASGRLTPLKISIAGDIAEMRPKYVNVGKRLTNAHISPTGARALFEARGEILTVPAEKGDPRNVTSTTRRGRRTGSGSRTSRTPAANTSCTSAIHWGETSRGRYASSRSRPSI